LFQALKPLPLLESAMGSKYNRSLLLTSTVIPFCDDGIYSFDVILLLLSNEMLRREFQQGDKAVNIVSSCFSSSFTKIQLFTLLAVLEWLNDFLIPILLCHDIIQEKVLFPYYSDLMGTFDNEDCHLEAPETTPSTQREKCSGRILSIHSESFHRLKGRVPQLRRLTKKMSKLINMTLDFDQRDDDFDKSITRIETLVEKMKEEYAELMFQYQRRFNEEERIWPTIIKKHDQVLHSVVFLRSLSVFA
jgi:flagellar capping protein FliD